MQLLTGHISPETAYLVEDYPFGFRLRCKIRYWIEYRHGKGFRFMSQTTDPRKGNIPWNKPKASTYCEFGGAMYLDDVGHVQWAGLSQYSDAKQALDFAERFGAAVPIEGQPVMRKWVAAKVAYETNRNPDGPLSQGLLAAHKAWYETK